MERVDQTFRGATENCLNSEASSEKSSETTPEVALASLRSILDAQDFALIEKIAAALGVPQPYLGLVTGISYAAQCLSRLCEHESFSKLHQFSEAATRISSQLSHHSGLPPHLTAVPDLQSLMSPFRLFAERGNRHSEVINNQICAIKALAFTDAVARGRSISESFASRLLTLQRCASKEGESSKHWQQLASGLPFDQGHACALAEQTTFEPVREFLRELLPLLDGQVPDLAPKTGRSYFADENRVSTIGSEIVSRGGQAPDGVEPEEDAAASNGYAVSEGLVAWQNKRATNAHRLAACGFPYGWDHLHPDELRQTTKKIATILANPSADTRDLACLALISLASGLPPKLALEISLEANDDLWLDVDSGLLCWNLNRVVQRNPPDPTLLARSYHPSSMIRLPLPVLLVSNLKRLKLFRGEASKVDDLLFLAEPDKGKLLRRYEQFLKLGDLTSHGPRPSRFAYSFGRCVLKQTGQDVVAALISFDFALAAPGQLHYACLNESVLFDAIDEAYDFLGLGGSARPETSNYIGSPLRPRDEVIVDGWREVLEETNRLKSTITPRMEIGDFISAFNKLSSHHLGAITFLTGHRGTRLERLTYPMLFSSLEFLSVSDKKSSEYSAYRILPRFKSLDAVLESHLSLLRSLATRLERHDRKLAKRVTAISSGKRKSCPLFFFIREKEKSWELRPITTGNLADYFLANFSAARNFGRHFWLSKLIEKNASRMLPRFFLGHARRGMEPHGAAGGISVRTACEAICPILTSIASDFGFPDPAPAHPAASRPARVPFQFPRVLANLQNDFVADYIASVNVSGHVANVIAEPCPFDRMTLAGHTASARLRSRFVDETKSLSAWPRFLVALIVFDGVYDARLLEAAWLAIPDRLLRVGQTPILECTLPSGIRPLLLQIPTATCLNHAFDSPVILFAQACREISNWAKALSGFEFSTPMAGVTFLGALMVRWMRIELSPWLMTASCVDFSAASISMRSLARLAYGRPAVSDADQPEPPITGRTARSSFDIEIGGLAKIVNDIADTTKKHGENQKRLRLLHEAITGHLRSSSLSPLSTDIATWLIREATSERPLEVSSIASYLSKLRDGLKELDQEMGFEDLGPDEWLDLKECIENGHAGEQLKQRQSILRRFADFWRDRGCAVPGSVFSAADGAAAVIAHASAIYLSGRDVEQIAGLIADHFKSQPLLREKATVKLSLCASAPFRSGEISRLRSIDVSPNLPGVFITSSGFSHLKNQRHSRGSVELGQFQLDQLRALCDRVSHLSRQKEGYVWLLDEPESRFADVAELDHALGRALRLTSGEANARVHSLRGSAIARIVTPEVDDLLANLATSTYWRLPAPSAHDDEWLKVSIAARQARHSRQLTTIQYYCSTWPLQLHLELARTLEFVPVDDAYAGLIDRLKPDAFRQALSRSRRSFPDAPLAEWQMLAKRLSRISNVRSVETLLVTPVRAPTLTPRKSDADALIDSQCIHYHLLRRVGVGVEVAINESRIPSTYTPMLEELCRQAAAGASEKTAGDKRDWQRRLANSAGQQLVWAAARCHNISSMATAVQLFDTETKCNIHEDILLQIIRMLRDVVPQEFTFSVLPSIAQSSALLQRKMRAIDPNASVKRSSKRHGTGYTLTVTAVAPEKQGPQPDGKATSIFRHALLSRIFLLMTQPKGSIEDVCQSDCS